MKVLILMQLDMFHKKSKKHLRDTLLMMNLMTFEFVTFNLYVVIVSIFITIT